MFIRIGNHVINSDAVDSFELDDTPGEPLTVRFRTSMRTETFNGPDAWAAWKLICDVAAIDAEMITTDEPTDVDF